METLQIQGIQAPELLQAFREVVQKEIESRIELRLMQEGPRLVKLSDLPKYCGCSIKYIRAARNKGWFRSYRMPESETDLFDPAEVVAAIKKNSL